MIVDYIQPTAIFIALFARFVMAMFACIHTFGMQAPESIPLSSLMLLAFQCIIMGSTIYSFVKFPRALSRDSVGDFGPLGCLLAVLTQNFSMALMSVMVLEEHTLRMAVGFEMLSFHSLLVLVIFGISHFSGNCGCEVKVCNLCFEEKQHQQESGNSVNHSD